MQTALELAERLPDPLELGRTPRHELDQRCSDERMRLRCLVRVRRLPRDVLQKVEDIARRHVDRLVVRAHSTARDEMVAELAQAPDADVYERLLHKALLHVEVQLDNRVGVELGRRSYNSAEALSLLLFYVVATQAHHLYQGVELPPAVWRILFHGHADPAAEVLLKVGVSHQEVVQQLLGHTLDVFLIHKRVGHVKGPLPDRDVRVLQAIDNGGTMSLDSLQIDVDHTLQSRKSHIADVVVAAEKEAAEDVNA
mmetsp:Transcript_85937/g.184184  ORF Transcript_85937/g.184184 Transcript_85937/m.184184 type:complete len:254 (+) Transcript_85937:500-1261(+)